MSIRATITTLAVLLATAACGHTTTTGAVSDASAANTTVSTTKSIPDDTATATWGKRYTWPDGLAVEVAAPTTCKPGKYAQPQGVQRAVKLTVTVVNGTKEAYQASLLSAGADAQFAGRKADPVFDSSGPCGSGGGMDSATVLPGKTYTYDVAYVVGPDPGELQLVFEPHLGGDKAVFVGQA